MKRKIDLLFGIGIAFIVIFSSLAWYDYQATPKGFMLICCSENHEAEVPQEPVFNFNIVSSELQQKEWVVKNVNNSNFTLEANEVKSIKVDFKYNVDFREPWWKKLLWWK